MKKQKHCSHLDDAETAALSDDIRAAVRKLHTNGRGPDGLTLEEVMMCYYLKPCVRVTPPAEPLLGYPYREGSVLVYDDRVELVLKPEANTLRFPSARSRFVGAPSKRFHGLLPGSRFRTVEGICTYMEERDRVAEIRNLVREAHASIKQRCAQSHPSESFFAANEVGKLNDHRCKEAFGLAGAMKGSRFRSVLRAQFGPSEWD